MKSGWFENLAFNNLLWAQIQKKQVIPVWKESLKLPEDCTALEVGCGRGVGSASLLDAFNLGRLDAFDIDEKLVKKAGEYVSGEYGGRIRVYVGDVTQIQSGDGTYDAVFDFFTLNQVGDWRKGLSEISRVLKSGGFFAFAEVYGEVYNWHIINHFLVHPEGERIERQSLVKGLAEERLRLMEKRNNLWGNGLVGVARKV